MAFSKHIIKMDYLFLSTENIYWTMKLFAAFIDYKGR